MDSMLPCVSSVTDHRSSQNVAKTKKWYTSLRRVCHYVFISFYRLLCSYYRTVPRQRGIYLFYIMIRKEKKTDTHTCLVPLDCWTICASFHILSLNATFRLSRVNIFEFSKFIFNTYGFQR